MMFQRLNFFIIRFYLRIPMISNVLFTRQISLRKLIKILRQKLTLDKGSFFYEEIF